ncbi:MAG: RDD family protein [Burkholderiales bacterium]
MRLDTLHRAETPEGISLALRPAGIVARVLAYLIDFAIRGALLIVVAIAMVWMEAAGVGLFLVSFFAIEWLYPVVFELSKSGATPGKRSMGLRVVMDSGLPVTPAASLTRNLLRAADLMPAFYGIGLCSMLLRPDCKRLGDLAAGTLVVHGDTVSLHGKLPPAAPLAPARLLTRQEQTTIVACAGRAPRLTPQRFEELAALARPVLGDAPVKGTPNQADAWRLLGVAQWLLGHRGAGGPSIQGGSDGHGEQGTQGSQGGVHGQGGQNSADGQGRDNGAARQVDVRVGSGAPVSRKPA